jgi:RimJ/RimL family protein N-acetyltransferase
MTWCRPDFATGDALQWFAACRDNAGTRSAFEYGLYTLDGAHLLGGVGLNQIDWIHRRCNLGYWVREPCQRQGIALAAVAALSKFSFQDLGLQRVEIVVAVGNTASAGVAEKSGAVFECVARNRLLIHGKPVAARVYSLIPADMPDAAWGL